MSRSSDPDARPHNARGRSSSAYFSPLDKEVQYVRGVGPHRAKLLKAADIATVGDLIHYFPFRYEEQPRPQRIDTLILDESATIIGVVERVRVAGRFKGATVHATINDGTGQARVTWFNASYLRDRLERGQVLRLYGKVDERDSYAHLANPRVEWLDPDEDPANWDYGKLVPVYRAIDTLATHQIRRLVETALDDAWPALTETLPQDLVDRHELPARRDAIRTLHMPKVLADVDAARKRLAYEELLLMQLAVTLQKNWADTNRRATKLHTTGEIDRRIRRRFPFELTAAQDRVIGQIVRDLGSDRPMTRLLQGDVGSGKTVVALYAALVAVANRTQCAILAPTSVLAEQHFRGIDRYLSGSRVKRKLLTGRTSQRERGEALKALAGGKMDLVVGTQALLEETVRFRHLGLVIVDEQHKFGVAQRASLRHKHEPRKNHPDTFSSKNEKKVSGRFSGYVPHYLVMTATPIPRTLSMTVFGDLDVSVIDALPPGRQPIVTRVARSDDTDAWLAVRRRIAAGEQAYVVYPLVEESETLDVKAATTEVHRIAQDVLPGTRVGLMHGRMKKNEKQAVMQAFADGDIDVLVSTTVVEVGVDVPNATCMVIEHAERFGLSALHQLRGRVGRGTKPSVCLLMTDSAGEVARQRLGILTKTTDGFRIAEEDLRIRGPGEMLGTRQHGLPELRVANLVEDVHLLLEARDDAAEIVAADARLRMAHHGALRSELRRRFRDKVAFIDVG